MNFLTLDEFIEKLKKLQKQGLGDKRLIFDECYSISDVNYDADADKISVI